MLKEAEQNMGRCIKCCSARSYSYL